MIKQLSLTVILYIIFAAVLCYISVHVIEKYADFNSELIAKNAELAQTNQFLFQTIAENNGCITCHGEKCSRGESENVWLEHPSEPWWYHRYPDTRENDKLREPEIRESQMHQAIEVRQ